MNRRIVSILLLPCVLLTQSVAVLGHSHEGGQPAGHGSRPHFHASSSSAERDYGHQNHGSHGHHHHHDGRDTDPALHTEPAPRPEPLPQHDSDAVYVDLSVAVNERPAVQKDLANVWELVPAGACLPSPLATDSLQTAAHWIRGPLLYGCACALYISQRALLI